VASVTGVKPRLNRPSGPPVILRPVPRRGFGVFEFRDFPMCKARRATAAGWPAARVKTSLGGLAVRAVGVLRRVRTAAQSAGPQSPSCAERIAERTVASVANTAPVYVPPLPSGRDEVGCGDSRRIEKRAATGRHRSPSYTDLVANLALPRCLVFPAHGTVAGEPHRVANRDQYG